MTELCDIALKYGTDKCPTIKHHFTEFYHEMFDDRRNEISKVVEIGIGRMAPLFKIGASLYMWQEYFENAQIFGADIVPALLFNDERITTFLCDQTKAEDLKNLIARTGSDIDLFIDDGLHTPESQVFTCLTVMPLLDSKTIYIIEDCGFSQRVAPYLVEYNVKILRRARRKYNDDCMVMVRKWDESA